ncbi:hypothetical protein [Burkholderia ubonensis]|uniref:hypothetical protein n=1 Tax=Burkholderia ubonensis TaxID=101571 RepID=UPI0012FA30F4|nr:hypothetical protein [Burkholderia ubonensis]
MSIVELLDDSLRFPNPNPMRVLCLEVRIRHVEISRPTNFTTITSSASKRAKPVIHDSNPAHGQAEAFPASPRYTPPMDTNPTSLNLHRWWHA